MTKGLPRSRGHQPASREIMKLLKVPVKNLAVSVAGTTGDGFGAVAAAALPEGNVIVHGAVAYLQLTKQDANATATFTGAVSLGSAQTADATLSGSEVDIAPSAALAAATAGVSPVTRMPAASPVMIDNTDKSKSINLNVKIDDATISGTAVFLVNGYIELLVSVLGDD